MSGNVGPERDWIFGEIRSCYIPRISCLTTKILNLQKGIQVLPLLKSRHKIIFQDITYWKMVF